MALSAIAFTLISSLLTATGGTTRSAVYPISPRTLRQLVEESQVIVAVKVRAPEPELDPEFRVLDVEQALKGDPGCTSIHLWNFFLLCPEPARYHADTRALAFLDRVRGTTAPDPDSFVTHALSYGSKTLNDADLALYVERVKEQLAILAAPAGAQRRSAQLAWIVRCAEQPATRWEGAYELAPDGDRVSRYDKVKRLPYAAELTADQRRRLLDALMATPRFGGGEACLERLFRDDADPRLLPWLVARLRATLELGIGDESNDPDSLADRIGHRDPRPRIRELAAALHEARRWPADPDEEKRVAAERRRLVTELLALFPQ